MLLLDLIIKLIIIFSFLSEFNACAWISIDAIKLEAKFNIHTDWSELINHFFLNIYVFEGVWVVD